MKATSSERIKRLGERPLEFATERAEGGVGGGRPRDDENTEATACKGLAKNRRQTAADGIANHCFPDGFPDRDAGDRGTIARQSVGPINGQDAGRDAPPTLAQPVEIGRASQTGVPAH